MTWDFICLCNVINILCPNSVIQSENNICHFVLFCFVCFKKSRYFQKDLRYFLLLLNFKYIFFAVFTLHVPQRTRQENVYAKWILKKAHIKDRCRPFILFDLLPSCSDICQRFLRRAGLTNKNHILCLMNTFLYLKKKNLRE